MRDDDDDDYYTSTQAWAFAEGGRDDRRDGEAEAEAEAIQRRLGADRLLSMWRNAVGVVGEVVKAEHEREREPDREHARSKSGWGQPARSLVN